MHRVRAIVLAFTCLPMCVGLARAGEDGGAGSESAAEATRPSPVAPVAPVAPERPYPVGRRPRPEGAVQASVLDEDLARWNVGGTGDPKFVSNRTGFHPAPRVKVDTSVRSRRLPEHSTKKGTLSQAGVLAETRNKGYWPFRLCFEAGLRRARTLGGKTHIRAVVATNGRVRSSRVLSTELDPETATCLAARARELVFSPRPSRRFEVDLTIDLTHGDAPLPDVVERSAPEGAAGAASEKFNPARAAAALAPALPAVVTCYAKGTARDPRLWGRLAIRIDLDAGGTVHDATEAGSRFPDRDVVACVIEAVRAVAFARPGPAGSSFIWGLRLGARPSPGVAIDPLPQRSEN